MADGMKQFQWYEFDPEYFELSRLAPQMHVDATDLVSIVDSEGELVVIVEKGKREAVIKLLNEGHEALLGKANSQ